MREFQDIMLELVECLRETSREDSTSFELFVSAGSFSFKFNNRTAEQLRKEGISMRNLRGDFIK